MTSNVPALDPRLPASRLRARRRVRRRHGRNARAVRPDERGLRRVGRQVPRGARAEPPGRDRGRARLDARRRRGGARDRHVPGLADQARRVGPGRLHRRDQHQGRGNRAQGGGRAPLRRRLDRPDRLPARLRGPIARADPLRRAGGGLHRAGRGPDRRRRGPADHRDRPGHPRGQGRRVRRARGVQEHRSRAADPHLRVAAAQRRQDAARDGHLGGAHHAGGAEGRCDRPELLDRPGGHARRDPLPRRTLPGAGSVHPQRRPAAAGSRRRDDLPREARAAGGGAEGVRRALRRRRSSAAAAAPPPPTSPRSPSELDAPPGIESKSDPVPPLALHTSPR